MVKAWIKENRGSIKEALNAPIYDFVDAFGMPGFALKYLSKEYDGISNGNKSEKGKEDD